MKALLLSAVAATLVAPTLNAQPATAKPDSTCTNYPDGRVECKVVRRSVRGDSAFGNRMFFRMDSAMAKRAAIGLELRSTGTRRDTLGVFVEAVTPKGPAENAGIIEGDRIAAINGVDLRTPAGDTDDEYVNGLAAHRLSREVQKLTPGARVTLRVYSGGRFRDVQVTAGKASDVMGLGGRFNFRVPGPGGMMEFNGPGGAMMFDRDMRNGRAMQRLRQPLSMPRGIHLRSRSPMRIRTLAPLPDMNDDLIDSMMLDPNNVLIDIEDEIAPVPPDVIRDLAATAIRDAQSALRQLAAEQVA